MGVENGTGTDTRTETTDKPPSQDRPSAPPPDNPGSPGQPSRLESRARAREAQQAEAQGTDGSPRDDRPGPSPTQTSGEKPETSPNSGPADKDQGTENRSNKGEVRETDHPAPGDKANGPPPDNPGSLGQPSRLESIARAREAQQAHATEHPAPRHGQPESPQARDAQPASQTPETNDKPQTATDNEAEPPKPPADRDDPSSQPPDSNRVTENHEHITEGGETDRPGLRDQTNGPPPDNPGTPGQPSRLESIARAREAQQAHATEHPDPRNGQLEPTEGSDAQPQGPETEDKPQVAPDKGSQEPPTDTSDQPSPQAGTTPPDTTDASRNSALDNHPDPAKAQSDPEIEPTGQKPETSAPDSDAGSPTDEPDSQRNTDDAHTSPEGVTQDEQKSSPYGDQGIERDKTTTESESGETGQHLDPSDRRSDPTREEEEPGKELTPQDENTTEVEEPSRFAGRVTILVDSDGKPIPERRHTETDDPNRGEPRHPEDDPVDRNPLNPEKRSRRRELLKEAIQESGDIIKATDKAVNAASDMLDFKPPPTGEPCTARDAGPYIEPTSQPPVKAGTAAYGILGAAILLTQVGRLSAGIAREIRGRDRASN